MQKLKPVFLVDSNYFYGKFVFMLCYLPNFFMRSQVKDFPESISRKMRNRFFVTLALIFFICSHQITLAQTLRVCYVTDTRSTYQDHGYTFDGQYMAGSGALKLVNTANFGEKGTVKQRVELISLKDSPITKETLTKANCGTVFVGMFYNPQAADVIGLNELNVIRNWSLEKKENLAVICESHAAAWGYERMDTESKVSMPTEAGKRTKIFDGPFGKVGRFVQGGHAIGWLKGGSPVVLATNEQGNAMVVYDEPTGDIILGDVDILTSLGGISQGKSIDNENDILFANIWAYAMELAKKQPPKATVKVTFRIYDKTDFIKISAPVIVTDKAVSSTEAISDSAGVGSVMLASNRIYRFQIRIPGYQDYFTEKYVSDTLSTGFDFALTPKVEKPKTLEKVVIKEKTTKASVRKLSFRVFDKVTAAGISAPVVITDKTISSMEIISDSAGVGSVMLASSRIYRFQIRIPGYQDYFTEKYVSDTLSTGFDFALTPKVQKVEEIATPGIDDRASSIIKTDSRSVLNQLFFEQSKSNILPASFDELDSLAERLKSEPNLKIELRGHTDKIGPADKNLILSIDRVKAVKNYLVGKGIVPARITTKGFGDTKLIYKGPDLTQRVKNRRVEIVILSAPVKN